MVGFDCTVHPRKEFEAQNRELHENEIFSHNKLVYIYHQYIYTHNKQISPIKAQFMRTSCGSASDGNHKELVHNKVGSSCCKIDQLVNVPSWIIWCLDSPIRA